VTKRKTRIPPSGRRARAAAILSGGIEGASWGHVEASDLQGASQGGGG